MKRFLLLILSFVLLGTGLVQAQLTGGKYSIVYNNSTCLYDVFLIPDGGTATTTATRIPRTSRISLVLPHGSTIGVTYPSPFPPFFTFVSQVPNEPKSTTNTIPGVGPAPVPWTQNDYYGPALANGAAGLPGYDVVAFDAPTNNVTYPSISSTSPILLFSLPITLPSGVNRCNLAVRLWNNNVIQGTAVSGGDPSSANIGNLTQYNNSFKIGDDNNGGQTEKYTGNVSGSATLPPPVLSAFALTRAGAVINGTVTATQPGSCATISSYAWTGPNSFSTSGTTVGSVNTFSRTTTSPADYGTYTVTVTNSNGCTATASASVGVPLPVKLLSFKGAGQGCQAQLAWEIGAGERGFQRFDVQYSADGRNFAVVGQVERNPYNDKYSFSYTQASGKGYYRLKIIDLGGKATYSEVAAVSTVCDNVMITIAPNPTATTTTVSGIEAGDQVKVTDMLGNVVANYVSGGSRATVDLEVFAPGVYSIIISRNTEILKAEKIIKQ